MALKVEIVSIEQLIPYINNAKLHPDDQVDKIAASIKEFGFNDPIAIDEENVIIAGHGRLMAAKKLKLEEVPVIRLEHMTAIQKKAYILAHNKTTMATGFDDDILKLELETLQDEIDLALTGFDEKEIDKLFAALEDDEAKAPGVVSYEPKLEVVAICKDENEQIEIFNLLTERGYQCRVLTQ